MYSFIPAIIFFGVGFWLYRFEWKKEPEMRNKANILIASYAVIIGIAMMIVSITNWGQL